MAGNSWGGTTVGTNYRGNRAAAPPNWSFENRNPNQYDRSNYVIGDLWLNKDELRVWVLVSLQGDSTSRGELATWIEWGDVGLLSLTGDTGGPVFADANKNINTLGTAGQIDVTGNPGTNTLTWSLDGSVATEYVENTGSAIPALGVLNVLGDVGISTTGFGNTITIDVEGEVALEYPTDAGTAIPALNVLNVFGGTAGRDINTTGAGNTIHVELNNAITVGDLSNIVGSAAVTATTGDVTISSGNFNITTGSNAAGTIGIVNYGGDRYISNFGTFNQFVGSLSGNLTLTGTQNTGVGRSCGAALTSGTNNNFFGLTSGLNVTSGSNNVLLGQAGTFVSTGSDNTMVGEEAGCNVAGVTGVTTGSNNVLIGSSAADNYTGAESNNIIIGAFNAATAGESNKLRIGLGTGSGTGQLNKAFISGIRGITTDVNNAVAVLVDSANQLGTVSSSRRYKENIVDMTGSEAIYRLRPVNFNYIEDEKKSLRYGLIAEEVAEDFPYLAAGDGNGGYDSVKYHELSVILLNEIQRLNQRIVVLEEKLG